MADSKNSDIVEQLMSLDKRTLATRAAKQLGIYRRQIAEKDRVIANYTSKKEQAESEAQKIIAEARVREASILEEAEKVKNSAQAVKAEAEREAQITKGNANAEADAIIETRLAEARGKISELEGKRDEAKRSAIALNQNVADSYAEIIAHLEENISNIKDLQSRLMVVSSEIEAEDFKKFEMSEFVSNPSAPEPSYSEDDFDMDDDSDLLLDDQFAAAAVLLGDDLDEDYSVLNQPETVEANPSASEPGFDAPAQTPASDDFDDFVFEDDLGDELEEVTPAAGIDPFAAQMDDFDADGDDDFGDIAGASADEPSQDGGFRSFTSSFPIIGDEPAEQPASGDEVDDFGDILDDDLDDFSSQPQDTLYVPERPANAVPSSAPRRKKGSWL